MSRADYYIRNKERLKKYQRDRYNNMTDTEKKLEIQKGIDRRNYILKTLEHPKCLTSVSS